MKVLVLLELVLLFQCCDVAVTVVVLKLLVFMLQCYDLQCCDVAVTVVVLKLLCSCYYVV